MRFALYVPFALGFLFAAARGEDRPASRDAIGYSPAAVDDSDEPLAPDPRLVREPGLSDRRFGGAVSGQEEVLADAGLDPTLPDVGQPLPGGPSRAPLRRAYQPPDIFRTPERTPLEQTPVPYAPQLAPGQQYPGSLPPPVAEPPMPPLAPLVNIRFTETWLPAARDDLGFHDFDLKGTLAMGRTGVFITPGYGVHFLNGPIQTDLPGTLYDGYVDIRWKKDFNPTWALELALTPSFFSDLENTSSDAWRFISTAIGYYRVSPKAQLMAGMMYLDRFDINWFPVFGLIYSDPDSDWRHEFVFPRPKFSRRLLRGDDKDGWLYIAGEFGGGAWAVERTNGADDMIAYRDWRATLGFESRVKDYSALSWYVEGGIVFQRELEYRSGWGDYSPDPAGMLRLSVSY